MSELKFIDNLVSDIDDEFENSRNLWTESLIAIGLEDDPRTDAEKAQYFRYFSCARNEEAYIGLFSTLPNNHALIKTIVTISLREIESEDKVNEWVSVFRNNLGSINHDLVMRNANMSVYSMLLRDDNGKLRVLVNLHIPLTCLPNELTENKRLNLVERLCESAQEMKDELSAEIRAFLR